MSLRTRFRWPPLAAVIPAALLVACGSGAAPGQHANPGAPARAAGPASPRDAGPARAGTDATAISRAAAMGGGLPGAPHCPAFPADNAWNTDISRRPVDSRSAAWLRSMDAGHCRRNTTRRPS